MSNSTTKSLQSAARPFLFLLLMAGAVFSLYHLRTTPNARPQKAAAQGEANSCDALIQEALQLSANNCLELGRNEACYAYNSVSTVLTNPDAQFAQRGDIVPVTDLESIITRPVNLETGEWGIVMMNLDADLPNDETGEDSVRLLLFGGTEITPTNSDQLVENRATCQVTNPGENGLNLRTGPGTQFPAVDILDPGETLPFYGRNTQGDWLRSSRGWVYAPLVTTECDTSSLQLISETEDAYTAPMQAFALTMSEDATCDAAPSGMLVQTPSGQTANLLVNNVEIRIGSTAYIRTREDGDWLVVGNIDGDVHVISDNFDQPIPAGAQVGIPIIQTEGGPVAGQPGNLEPLDGNLSSIAGGILPDFPALGELPPVWEPDIEVVFNAAPSSIPVGACTTLTWAVSNAEDAFLNGTSVALVGTRVECPVATTTYTLVASGAGESEVARQVTVEVTENVIPGPQPTLPTAPTVIIEEFSANPSALIQLGECTSLSWMVLGAANGVFLDDGTGEVPVAATGGTSHCPLATTNYTLRAVDSNNMSIYATLTVTMGFVGTMEAPEVAE